MREIEILIERRQAGQKSLYWLTRYKPKVLTSCEIPILLWLSNIPFEVWEKKIGEDKGPLLNVIKGGGRLSELTPFTSRVSREYDEYMNMLVPIELEKIPVLLFILLSYPPGMYYRLEFL